MKKSNSIKMDHNIFISTLENVPTNNISKATFNRIVEWSKVNNLGYLPISRIIKMYVNYHLIP